MNKGDLINRIAEDADLSKVQATDALNVMLEAIQENLKKGKKVTLVGFGTFSINKRKARKGRNPRTGEAIKIKAKKLVKFKAGKALDEAVN